jgi:AcrR family transcriptional regulator
MARRPGLDRAVIAREAALLADECGFHALSLVELAGRLGVRPPSLYNHVANLAEIKRDLAVLGIRELGARLARAAVGKAGDDAVGALAQAYRTFVIERPGLYVATERAPAPDDEEWLRVAGEVVGIVQSALDGYGLRGDDAIHAVRALRSLIHGFATLEQGGGFGIPLDLDESFRRLIAIYVAGVRATSTPAPTA